jgi:hypothetical protein
LAQATSRFTETKYLAQEAATGNPETVHTCLTVLIETIETDPEDLSDWTG